MSEINKFLNESPSVILILVLVWITTIFFTGFFNKAGEDVWNYGFRNTIKTKFPNLTKYISFLAGFLIPVTMLFYLFLSTSAVTKTFVYLVAGFVSTIVFYSITRILGPVVDQMIYQNKRLKEYVRNNEIIMEQLLAMHEKKRD